MWALWFLMGFLAFPLIAISAFLYLALSGFDKRDGDQW